MKDELEDYELQEKINKYIRMFWQNIICDKCHSNQYPVKEDTQGTENLCSECLRSELEEDTDWIESLGI